MQWTPYGSSVDEFKAHLRTFHAVFPHVLIAFGPGGYGFYLFGSDQPMAFDDATIDEVLARPGRARGHLVGLRLAASRRSTAGAA